MNIANVSTQAAGLFKGAAVGIEAYAAYVNSQGGINGRKIIVNASDDQFTGATNKQLTEEAVQSDFATVGSFSTEDSFGGVVLAANPQMPNVSIALDPATQKLPNTFAAVPPAAFWPLGPLVYFKDKFPTKVLHTTTIVADLPSTLNLWNYEKAAMDHVGYKVLYSPALPATTTDFTAQIVTMKDMGVQILFLEQEPQNYAASIFKDLDEQNFHPVVVLGAAAYSHQLVANSGGASNVDGAYLEQQEALFLGEDAPAIPAVATFNTWVQKVSPGFTTDFFALQGWLCRGALRARSSTRGRTRAEARCRRRSERSLRSTGTASCPPATLRRRFRAAATSSGMSSTERSNGSTTLRSTGRPTGSAATSPCTTRVAAPRGEYQPGVARSRRLGNALSVPKARKAPKAAKPTKAESPRRPPSPSTGESAIRAAPPSRSHP